MTTFDDRESAFETKFAHDAAMVFKAEVRADRKLALWAAGKLGKSAPETESYTAEVIRADMQEAGAEDVIRKVAADLAGIAEAEEIRALYARYLSEAKAELADA
ncbi:DUF1476 domain-containing protein [Celeribacter indicus]|uniref:Aldolase n=1 Tax=Celeribacter indicus TaxID=1208324 RepID=A0A0B5DTQ4_9RHOB|nr:DUF1476 domain-containing protein [Celeribacter indicus]AJE46449.1 hypothetical protein P73_1734 [Celeribacter indicus]SDW56991.1 hypothetical protein SAMN05443573_104290 [Celeribacter indicus]